MGRVIRRPDSRPHMPRPVLDAQQRAAAIVADARARASAIVTRAEQDVDAIRLRARSDGHADGVAQATSLLLSASRARDTALAQAEQRIRALALQLARRIVGEELATHPDRIADLVGRVLGHARRASRAAIRVHPSHASHLERTLARATEVAGAQCTATVVADESVQPDGCIVETDLGVLDGRIEVQFDALARALGVDPAETAPEGSGP